MKRFRFKLQRVLEIRQKTEERLQTAWAALEEVRRCEAARLADLEAELRRTQAELREDLLEACSPQEASSVYRYLRSLGQLIEIQRKALDEATAQATAARERWLDASRGRKVLERLRETEWDEHRKESLRNDVREADEFAAAGAAEAGAVKTHASHNEGASR